MEMTKSNNKGFTLVELMIVVAIIGILAAIAIPYFLESQAEEKQSEAKGTLKDIYISQLAYFAENGVYGSMNEIGYVPEEGGRYEFSLGTVAEKVGNADADACDASVSSKTDEAFIAEACANIDSDNFVDQWTITDTNVLANPANDVTNTITP